MWFKIHTRSKALQNLLPRCLRSWVGGGGRHRNKEEINLSGREANLTINFNYLMDSQARMVETSLISFHPPPLKINNAQIVFTAKKRKETVK